MTAAKLTANRTNAKHSTGPQNTQHTRFNGVQHGLTSKQTVIPGETQEAYDNFRTELLTDLKPKSATESFLADRIVAAAWRLQRFQRVEAAFFNNRIEAFLGDNPDADPDAALANLFVDPAETARMRLFLRYQASVQREYDKARTEFERAQTEREKQAFNEALMQSAAQAQPSQNAVARPIGFASHSTLTCGVAAATTDHEPTQLSECVTLNFPCRKSRTTTKRLN